MPELSTRRRTWSESDYFAAHGQILAEMAGRRIPAEDWHPLALEMTENGSAPSLVDMARAAAVKVYGDHAAAWDARQVLASGGAGSDHLGDLLSGLAHRLVLGRQPALLGPALKLCRGVELQNYQTSTVGTVELAAGIEPPTGANRPWQKLVPSGRAEQMALRSAPVRVRFSEILLLNDDINLVQHTLDAAGTSAAQSELSALFSLLNTDVALQDGTPAFHADHGNALAGQTKNLAALDAAVSALRAQVVNGRPADCAPRYLVVPAGDELAARALVRQAYGESAEVEVIASSYCETYWWLFSDPGVWPVLLRGTGRGTGGVSLRFMAGRPNADEGNRDLVLEALHTFDYAIASRVGAVRIGF